jgi:antitoxin component YwqK of YwqJK toxin-antitoxin module
MTNSRDKKHPTAWRRWYTLAIGCSALTAATAHQAEAKQSLALEFRNPDCLEGVVKGKKKSGVSKCYDKKNGKIRVQLSFKKGKRHGAYKEWTSEGQLVREEHYRDGKRHGVFRRHNRLGQLQEETSYRDGKRHGPNRLYCPKGKQVRTLTTYKNDTFDGLREQYDCRSGHPTSSIHYRAGKKHGPAKDYHYGTDAVSREYHYENDKRQGLERRYRKDGEVQEKCWRNGRVVKDLSACKQ